MKLSECRILISYLADCGYLQYRASSLCYLLQLSALIEQSSLFIILKQDTVFLPILPH